jgi:hypothetical protein
MTPPLNFTDAKTQLALLTSQGANFTFTDDELTQALQTAWGDTYVCVAIWDDSLTYTTGTWQYTIPTGLTRVQDIFYKRTTTDYPELLSKELYDIVDGKIQFNVNAVKWLGDTYTLYLKGLYKLTTDDELPTDNLVNYTLSLAAYTLLKMLIYKRNFVFLRNDTSMSDIINSRRDMQADMLRYKQALLREFESA